MKPSQLTNSVAFAYKVYKMKCRNAGTQPIPFEEFHVDTIRRILNILLPGHAKFRMEMDDDGTTAVVTHDSHPPYNLSIKANVTSNAYVAWYNDGEGKLQKIASFDVFDIVEFCIVALRKYNFIFQKSSYNPAMTMKAAKEAVKNET